MNSVTALRRPARILLAEDNDDDAELIQLALAESGIDVSVARVRNGEDCMTYLRAQKDRVSAATPDLVLLDLNMPRMDGREVMAAILEDRSLWHIPVVVLTTSSARQDVRAAQQMGFNSVFTKPVSFVEFRNAVKLLCSYWFSVVALPQP